MDLVEAHVQGIATAAGPAVLQRGQHPLVPVAVPAVPHVTFRGVLPAARKS